MNSNLITGSIFFVLFLIWLLEFRNAISFQQFSILTMVFLSLLLLFLFRNKNTKRIVRKLQFFVISFSFTPFPSNKDLAEETCLNLVFGHQNRWVNPFKRISKTVNAFAKLYFQHFILNCRSDKKIKTNIYVWRPT